MIYIDENSVLYTDYPFAALGDTPCQAAPIREVSLISYDGDKYAEISVEGIKQWVKLAYLYLEKGRCGEVYHVLPIMIHPSLLDNCV